MEPDVGRRPLVVAVDVGTSSCRASLYDADGVRLKGLGQQLAYQPHLTADGGAELSAPELLERVGDTLDALCQQAGPALADVRAVGLSTFWHSLLGVDDAWQPVTPLYPWLDSRARAAARHLRQTLDRGAVHARTGCEPHWSYWPARLVWLRAARPNQVSRVARWVSFGDYLLQRWFGEAQVSVSIASGTGLLDLRACDWDAPLLQAIGLEQRQLTPIATADAAFHGLQPPYAERWPALREIPWLPPLGDGACSNLGAGCEARERAALMLGTSGAMRLLWRGAAPAIPDGLWCYRLDRERPVMGGAINDGGSLLDWLRTTLRLPPAPDLAAAVAALPPDGHGLTILPLWGGERSPAWADDARGAIAGLRLSHDAREIYRAALEAVAIWMAGIARRLESAEPGLQEVVATGGALLHTPAWPQILADVLDRTVVRSSELEASSRGVALAALEALGERRLAPVPTPSSSDVFKPDPASVARYRDAIERQARLYRLLVAAEPAASAE
ncbi:MAG: gluconokinase [Chloroflexi bacterium]|nr:gluconokinase [Chloroflexota bacterium]